MFFQIYKLLQNEISCCRFNYIFMTVILVFHHFKECKHSKVLLICITLGVSVIKKNPVLIVIFVLSSNFSSDEVATKSKRKMQIAI